LPIHRKVLEIKVSTIEIQGLTAMLGYEQVVECSILGGEYRRLIKRSQRWSREGKDRGKREGNIDRDLDSAS